VLATGRRGRAVLAVLAALLALGDVRAQRRAVPAKATLQFLRRNRLSWTGFRLWLALFASWRWCSTTPPSLAASRGARARLGCRGHLDREPADDGIKGGGAGAITAASGTTAFGASSHRRRRTAGDRRVGRGSNDPAMADRKLPRWCY